MTELATVTAVQIAQLAGVGRAAVSNWRKRYIDFPQPVGGTLKSPTFALAEVEAWLRAQGKLVEVGAGERLWHELNANRYRNESAANAIARVGLFLHHLDEHPGLWQSLETLEDARLGAVLEEEMTARAAALPAPLLEPLTVAHIPCMRMAAAAMAETPGARPGATVFFRLLDRYQTTHARQSAATPTQLAGLMSMLSGPGSTLDPACGLGTLLHAVRRHGDTNVYGQDSDGAVANLAAIRMLSMGWSPAIRVGDVFADDTFPELGADSVLCDPPANDRGWNPDEHTFDSRFNYGLPPRSEPELAWIQHCLSKVRPGGSVVILVPAVAGSRPTGRRIRAELIRRGALREVIGLPAGFLAYKTVPVHLWVLRRPDDKTSPRDMLLVDVKADRSHDDIVGAVLRAHERFADAPSSVDMPGFASSVPAIELLDDLVDLTPARWVAGPETEVNADNIQASLDDLTALLSQARAPQQEFVRHSGTPSMVTIAELISRGEIEILTAQVRTAISDGDEPVLTVADVTEGRAATGLGSASDGATRTRVGDVVVPVAVKSSTPRVLEEGGALLGPHLVLLRPKPDALDPWFLAGFLATPENARLASSQSSVHRIGVKQARLPRLALDAQRRYGDYFRRLSRLRDTLTAAMALTGELAEQSAAALVAGVIDLPD